jgi:DNA-binding response OmpR family regulator
MTAGHRMRLLLVEDETAIACRIREGLEEGRYAVDWARDGVEALALARERDYAAIVLDLMLPGMSGYEVCQRIREREEWRHIKVVMLSAKGRDAEVNKGLALGADVYMTKPFSTRDLMSRIRGLLEAAPA